MAKYTFLDRDDFKTINGQVHSLFATVFVPSSQREVLKINFFFWKIVNKAYSAYFIVPEMVILLPHACY